VIDDSAKWSCSLHRKPLRTVLGRRRARFLRVSIGILTPGVRIVVAPPHYTKPNTRGRKAMNHDTVFTRA
jgi:hypothetical protein